MKGKIIAAILIVIAFIAGYFIGDSSAISRVNKELGTNPRITNITVNQPETKKDDAKESLKSINLSEQAAAGDLGIKVLEAKESESISNKAGKSTPSGKFVIIKLEIKNNATGAIEYSSNDFALKNDKSLYEVDDNAFKALGNLNMQETIYNKNSNFIGVYDKFNPGLTKNTYIVFDVPKESKIEELKLIDSQAKDIQFNLK